MSQFIPQNELEVAFVKARSKDISTEDLIKVLIKSDVAVPSRREIMADGSGFQPLLVGEEQVTMVACFTAKERIGSFVSLTPAFVGLTPYCLVTKGSEFMRWVPSGYGVIVNPGLPAGFTIHPEGLAQIVRDFALANRSGSS